LYGGYDLLGYQVVNGRLSSVNDFLGLRVASGGFAPHITKQVIKQATGDETLWYICSRSAGKPQLIKLWQNSSDSVKGSLSLTETLLKEKERAESAWCRPGDNTGELEIVVEKKGSYYWRTFRDLGFQQNKDYQLVTNNLFKDQGEVVKVIFDDLRACTEQVCGKEALTKSLTFSVSGNGQDFWNGFLGKEIIFPAESLGIYWMIKATSHLDKIHYSPWIDGLLSISYAWNQFAKN